jgi:DNA repair protein RadC
VAQAATLRPRPPVNAALLGKFSGNLDGTLTAFPDSMRSSLEPTLLDAPTAIADAALLRALVEDGPPPTRRKHLRAVASTPSPEDDPAAAWSVARVACATPGELRVHFGPRGAQRLRLALEFSERLIRARLPTRQRMLHPADIYSWAKGGMRSLPHEELWLLALDGQLRMRSARRLAQGGSFGLALKVSDVLRAALECAASGFVLVHNHPSGSLEPSPEDLAFTQRVSEAAAVIGLPLLDHVIVTFGGYVSIITGNDT